MTRLKCNITEKDSEGDIYTEIEKKKGGTVKNFESPIFCIIFSIENSFE